MDWLLSGTSQTHSQKVQGQAETHVYFSINSSLFSFFLPFFLLPVCLATFPFLSAGGICSRGHPMEPH